MKNRLSDAEYKKRLDEFFELATVIKMPIPEIRLTVSLLKPERMPETSEEMLVLEEAYRAGKLIPIREKKGPSRSWARNLWNIMTRNLLDISDSDTTWGDGHINIKQPDGTVYMIASNNPYISAGTLQQTTYGNDDNFGIWIGTDTTAETFDDYTPVAQIMHGDGSDQMRYWDMPAIELSWSSGDRKFTTTASRFFSNHSGASITVGEVALMPGYAYTGVNAILTARDVLSPTWAVANLEILRIEYDLVTAAFPS